EGRLADGLPMRMYLAEDAEKVWSASMHDNEHPLSEDEFLWGLSRRSNGSWAKGAGSDVLSAAAEQVLEYFAGERLNFDLPLSLRGTSFQVRVWQELIQIPFGAT